jgi:hypothetical protein
MLLVLMLQDVSSSGRPKAIPNAEVHTGPPDKQVELSAQKEVHITNFSRIHEQYLDNRPFLELSDLKAALVAFLISWGLLCMLFACNKDA